MAAARGIPAKDALAATSHPFCTATMVDYGGAAPAAGRKNQQVKMGVVSAAAVVVVVVAVAAAVAIAQVAAATVVCYCSLYVYCCCC